MAETSLVSLPDNGGVFTSGNLTAVNSAITAQNANNTSLRSSITGIGPVLYSTINLTLAQILALNATPLALVAAQGAGTLIEFVGAVLQYVKGSAAFTIGSAGNLTFNHKADGSGAALSVALASTGFWDQASNQIRIIKAATTNTDVSLLENQPLVMTIATADMTVGTGSSGILKLSYRVHTGLS